MGFCNCAQAASTVVWQIGKFDKSSIEFKLHEAPGPKPGAGQAQTDLVYVIGKSKAEADWPAFQPGSSNGIAGYRAASIRHPVRIAVRPRGLYTLKVALLVESPRVSPRSKWRSTVIAHCTSSIPCWTIRGAMCSSVFLPNYSADTITAEVAHKFLAAGGQRTGVDGE